MVTIVYAIRQEPDGKQFILDMYEKYNSVMASTARKYIASPNNVEDIVQESLIKLMKKVGTLQSMECCTLTAYIVATVRNTAINRLKSMAAEKKYSVDIENLDFAGTPFETQTLDDVLICAERKDFLSKIWPDLPQEDQMLLSGKYILGYTDQELANLLGCRKGSIRMKLTRARRRALLRLSERGVINDKT